MAFVYVLGIIVTLILGVGMCFVMKAIGNAMITEIIIGARGIIIIVLNYPLYYKILNKRKAFLLKLLLKVTNC